METWWDTFIESGVMKIKYLDFVVKRIYDISVKGFTR